MVAVAVYMAKLLPQDRTKKLLIFILFAHCVNYYFSDDAQILIESHFPTIFFCNYTVCKFATCPQQFCQLQFIQWKMISMHLKSPYVLHANSQEFLQHCLWNHSTVCLLMMPLSHPFKKDHWALPISSFIARVIYFYLNLFVCFTKDSQALPSSPWAPPPPCYLCWSAGVWGVAGAWW